MIAAAVLFSTTSPAHCGDSYLRACAFASAHACVRANARVPLQWRRVTDNANAVSGYAKIAFDCVRAVVKGLPHGGQRIVRLLQRPCATMRDDESALARGIRPALPLQRGAPGRRSRCGKRKEEEVRQHSTKWQTFSVLWAFPPPQRVSNVHGKVEASLERQNGTFRHLQTMIDRCLRLQAPRVFCASSRMCRFEVGLLLSDNLIIQV